MKGRLFITKPIELARQETADTERGLRCALGPLDLVMLGVGAIACLFAGLCYAEMAAMIPIAGSAYTYSYTTYHSKQRAIRYFLG